MSSYFCNNCVGREGTWMTASAHIVTAVIGSGVLSLAWAVAQLGWIAGPVILMLFSFITLYTSFLLCNCYRYPDSVHGTRNVTYMDMVKTILGNFSTLFLLIFGDQIQLFIYLLLLFFTSRVFIISNCKRTVSLLKNNTE